MTLTWVSDFCCNLTIRCTAGWPQGVCSGPAVAISTNCSTWEFNISHHTGNSFSTGKLLFPFTWGRSLHGPTDSSLSLHVPRSLHRTIGDHAFPVAAAKVWNALPPVITLLPSLGAFKRALKTELFLRSYGNANYRPQQHWHYSCSVIRDT